MHLLYEFRKETFEKKEGNIIYIHHNKAEEVNKLRQAIQEKIEPPADEEKLPHNSKESECAIYCKDSTIPYERIARDTYDAHYHDGFITVIYQNKSFRAAITAYMTADINPYNHRENMICRVDLTKLIEAGRQLIANIINQNCLLNDDTAKIVVSYIDPVSSSTPRRNIPLFIKISSNNKSQEDQECQGDQKFSLNIG